MKRLYYLLYIGFIACFFACQSDEDVVSNIGYLRLSVGASSSANTKTVSEDYKPKQIAVQIVNAQGKVVEETDDSETWVDPIALETGTYTVKASSNGFDGQESGFDIPYYAGSKEITIKSNQEVQETIVCTLANVKVTVKFDAAFLEKFAGRDISVQVGDQTGTNKFTPLNFSTAETRSAYFPVGNLYATLSVSNPDKPLEPYTLKQEFTEVKVKDHYILNYKLQETGETNITVTVDPTMHEYSYTFTVSTEATNNASLTAGAWDRLAYLKAENVTTASGVSMEGITFQYRIKTDTQTKVEETSWNDVATTANESIYTAMLTGLNASTAYEYRLANGDGEAIGNIQEFTTASTFVQEELPNGNFEEWTSSNGIIYPGSSTSSLYWDTSNKGASTLGTNNPTSNITDPIVSGKSAAQLKSMEVWGVLAAASLYTGSFGSVDFGSLGATVNFGRSFTSRPIALHGYYKYTPANVKVGGSLPPNATVSEGSPDQCSIYIALSKKTYAINNKDEGTFINFESDNNIIAYGELPSGAATSGSGYSEFTIPLKYKESQFTEEPLYIIVVCSSSKYGDYMTGGVGSTLLVDDFELIYEGEPEIWENL